MELEVGVKITHTRDDLTSTTNLRVTKEPSGPLFVSKEIDTMFILEGHLKGIRRENIDIDINKYGNRITISGKKPVQEMVLMGWIMHRKEAVMRTFEKSFRIPDGAKLDRIKAKFNDERSVLTIRMPKRVMGISGVAIEEVEDDEVESGRLEPTETIVDKVPERESHEEVPRESKQPTTLEKIDQVEIEIPTRKEISSTEPKEEAGRETDRSQTVEKPPAKEIQPQKIPEQSIQSTKSRDDQVTQESEISSSSSTQVEEKHETCTEDQPLTKPEPYQEPKADEVNGGDQTQAEQTEGTEETPTCMENPSQPKVDELECQKAEKQKSLSEETKPDPGKSKVCTPIVVAGSAIIVSIIVLVIHFIRAKKR